MKTRRLPIHRLPIPSWRLLGVCALCLASLTLLVPGARAADDKDLTESLARLCRQLEEKRVEHHIPGMSLCIVKDDKILLTRGFGLRDRDKKLPVDENTLFAIGSSSKAFTSTMTAMLVDEGKLDWDDPVRKHIPYFKLQDKAANDGVTLRDLLCHRTGLTRMGVLWAANQVDREKVLRQVAEAKPMSGFRAAFHYNNVMVLAAGMASARAAGSPSWDALLKKRLLDPLGMKRSNSTVAKMLQDKNISKGYLWDGDAQSWKNLAMRELDAIGPAGAINSCAADMAQWLRLLVGRGTYQGKRLVSEAQLEETWKSQIGVGGDVSYGLGWMLRQWQGHKVVEHGGNIDGFAATVALIPDHKLGFVLLTNVSASPLQQQSLNIVWQALLGEPETARSSSEGKKKSPEELERYFGRYRIHMLGVDATVQIKGEKLAIDIPGQMNFTLKWPDPKGLWVFDFPLDIQIEFDEESPDKAKQLILYQQIKIPCPRTGETPAVSLSTPSPASGKKWSEEQMQPLLGKYKLTGVGVVTVLVKDEKLAVDIPGQTVYPLLWPDDDNCWVIEAAPDQSLRFAATADGRVTTMQFRRDLVLECPRIRPKPDLGVTLDDLIALQGESKDDASAGKTFRFEGTAHFVHQGVRGKFNALVASPSQFNMHLDISPFGYTTTVIDGDHGWIDSNLEPSSDVTGEILELLKISNPFAKYRDWRKSFKEIHILEKDELNGEKVYVVECIPFKAPTITKYVSTESGLVIGEKLVMIVKAIGITIPITVSYSDFRDVAGMKIPFRTTTTNDFSGEIVLQVTRVDEDATVPPGAFDKPGQ